MIVKKVPKKLLKDKGRRQDKDLEAEETGRGSESFAQKGNGNKDIRCFCCGREGELATDCPLKDKIEKNEWFSKTGKKHFLKKNHTQITTTVQPDQKDDAKIDPKTGFSLLQVAKVMNQRKILLDSGSTISLFKDDCLLKTE